MRILAVQLRMARAALRWSVEEAADRSALGERTIRRLEAHDETSPIDQKREVLWALVECYEAHGIEFRSAAKAFGVYVRPDAI